MSFNTIQQQATPVTPDWTEALSNFRPVETEYDRRAALEDAVQEAAQEMVTRVDEYFDVYRHSIGMERGMAHRFVHATLWRREFGDKGMALWPTQLRKEQEAKNRQIQEPDRVTDEFMEYQARWQAAQIECGVREAARYVEEMRDEYFAARAALIIAPGPDAAALLLKMELAFVSRFEEHEEATLADARRLLAAA